MRESRTTGRRSGEIRYHLDQQTVHATTKGTQTSALTALPTGQHGSMPCCHQATVRSWWAGTQLTVAPSGHLRRRRTGVERLRTPARRFELLPLPLSGPPRNLLEDSLLFPGRQPCEAIAIDRTEGIELGIISQSVMSPFTRSYMQTHRPRDYDAPQWVRTQHTARCKPGPAALPRERLGQRTVGLQTSSKSHREDSVSKGQALAHSLIRCPDRNAGRSRALAWSRKRHLWVACPKCRVFTLTQPEPSAVGSADECDV